MAEAVTEEALEITQVQETTRLHAEIRQAQEVMPRDKEAKVPTAKAVENLELAQATETKPFLSLSRA
jgi:hypothetical protein